MIWSRLKNYKCPKDNGYMNESPLQRQHKCLKCGYKISYEKFNEIVSDRYKNKTKTARFVSEEENMGELNNL